MASGLGMNRDVGLPHFASTFAENGYAVLLFDYQFWGGSTGEPRHLVTPRIHVEDYKAAVAHVQATNGLDDRVDPVRIILWGTSYSGGHSLAAASQLGKAVSAVIAMESFTGPLLVALAFFYVHFCPYSKGIPIEAVVAGSTPVTEHIAVEATMGSYIPPCSKAQDPLLQHNIKDQGFCCSATSLQGVMDLLLLLRWEVLSAVASIVRGVRMFLVGISDVIRGFLGLPAAYMPIVVPASAMGARLRMPFGFLRTPLALGVLTDRDYTQMMSAMPQQPLGGWKNLAAARMLFYYPTYRPLKDAAGLTCPVCLVAGRHDMLIPEYSIRKAASILARSVGEENVSVHTLDGTHISLYKAPELLPTMLQFLSARLPLDA